MIRVYYTFLLLLLVYIFLLQINFFIGQYVTVIAGPSVPDIFDFFGSIKFLLFRDISIDFHLFWNTFLLIPFLIYGLFFYPREITHFLFLKLLITFTRLCTIPLTNLGLVHNQPVINGLSYTFGGDLFFSGHVAGSFALVLIFRNTQIRYFLFLFHLIVVASAIVGRFHYAIDIVGAYAITYSLFKLTEPWYKNFEKKYLQPN